MKRIVLLRHGESLWNQENRFTGWTDVGSSSNLVVISFLFQLSSSFLILLKVVDMFAF